MEERKKERAHGSDLSFRSHKTEIERLKAEIKNIGQEEPEQPQPVKKKVSVVREEREKYMKSGKAMIGGVKARKRQGRKADDEVKAIHNICTHTYIHGRWFTDTTYSYE